MSFSAKGCSNCSAFSAFATSSLTTGDLNAVSNASPTSFFTGFISLVSLLATLSGVILSVDEVNPLTLSAVPLIAFLVKSITFLVGDASMAFPARSTVLAVVPTNAIGESAPITSPISLGAPTISAVSPPTSINPPDAVPKPVSIAATLPGFFIASPTIDLERMSLTPPCVGISEVRSFTTLPPPLAMFAPADKVPAPNKAPIPKPSPAERATSCSPP